MSTVSFELEYPFLSSFSSEFVNPDLSLQGKNQKTIGTHSGTFHCDEVMACYLLRMTQEYKAARIIRTRDYSVLEKLDCVVDVGDVYDPSTNRFDHHQRSFSDTFGGKYSTIRLSSAGLIWKHFGLEVLGNLTGITDPSTLDLLHTNIYRSLFLALDAIDNGVTPYDIKEPAKYSDTTTLAQRVSRINPPWNFSDKDADSRFEKAMQFCKLEFLVVLDYYLSQWLPARQIVKDSLEARLEVHPSGGIVRLSTFCPWKSHIQQLEEEKGVIVYYVLYQDSSSNWRVQCVEVPGQEFCSRLPLPEEWRGKRDQALAEVSGVQDAGFVHHSGFIGGAKSYEGVLAMANISLGQLNNSP